MSRVPDEATGSSKENSHRWQAPSPGPAIWGEGIIAGNKGRTAVFKETKVME